jgi:hypothetical protein
VSGAKAIDDARDVLNVLKTELEFIEKGRYRADRRIFRDSPTCLGFGESGRSRPCQGCILMHLVPANRRSEAIPCHHIPLTPEGKTIHFLERWETRAVLEATLKNWLMRMIGMLEQARGDEAQPERSFS